LKISDGLCAFSRKARKINDSLYFILPESWCEINKIEKGDKLAIVQAGNVLTILPNKLKEKGKKNGIKKTRKRHHNRKLLSC